jgi:hypothetical protein
MRSLDPWSAPGSSGNERTAACLFPISIRVIGAKGRSLPITPIIGCQAGDLPQALPGYAPRKQASFRAREFARKPSAQSSWQGCFHPAAVVGAVCRPFEAGQGDAWRASRRARFRCLLADL